MTSFFEIRLGVLCLGEPRDSRILRMAELGTVVVEAVPLASAHRSPRSMRAEKATSKTDSRHTANTEVRASYFMRDTTRRSLRHHTLYESRISSHDRTASQEEVCNVKLPSQSFVSR